MGFTHTVSFPPQYPYCHGLHFSKLDAECSSKVTHSLPRAKATAGKYLSRPLAPFSSVHLTVAPILPSRMSEVSLSLGVNRSVYGCVHSAGSVSACCTGCYSPPFRKVCIFENVSWKRRESTLRLSSGPAPFTIPDGMFPPSPHLYTFFSFSYIFRSQGKFCHSWS